jgi:DNA repair protein RAD50
MTSIDKMSIRGIRSFSPTETQVIEFYKPLTLIVGKNGSGKTTTIECLKMATTGDLPPNCRNGQAFINDPNVHNSSEVKAQIKLKFTTATGRPAVCTRSFSLVQKTTKKEYKAFEAALQTIDEKGDKTSLSYKCADLNKLVPEMMHVSTAVLDSVIFVHQEDACWPLQEDKVLKDRFDAIFAATNYTKALDAIKVYKADKAKDIKVLAAELETLETKLNEANRLREELRSNEERKEMLEAAMAKCRAAAQEGKDRLPERRAVLDQFHRVHNEYQQAATEHNHASDAAGKALQELIRQYGGPLEESDAELQEIETSQGAATVQMRTDLDKTRNQVSSPECA